MRATLQQKRNYYPQYGDLSGERIVARFSDQLFAVVTAYAVPDGDVILEEDAK